MKDKSSENSGTANAANDASVSQDQSPTISTMKKNSAAAARAEVFDALHQEMEFADYCTTKSGRKVRRVPRNQKAKKRAKRMALDEVDMVQMSIEADDDDRIVDASGGEAKKSKKRLRGVKVAFDDVVLKSMPIASNANRTENARKSVTREAYDNENSETNNENENEDDEDIVEEENERHDMLQEMASLGIELCPDEVEKIENFEEGDEECEADGDEDDGLYDDTRTSGSGYDEIKEDQDEKETNTQPQGDGHKVSVLQNGLIKPKSAKRVMHRLREFTSRRMAEKHGEAIGAHIRGLSETAVQKLRELAKSAPGAPQVYSSLGMVFESMLSAAEGGDAEQGESATEEDSRLNHFQRRLELIEKAYASYHVASILCKRDFVLWERSGDAAVKGAQIYSEIIDYMANKPTATKGVSKETVSTGDTTTRKRFDPDAGPDKWRAARKEWLKHALSAYESSDNLQPPGVDIPCKLAQVHIMLGNNLINALSILTDLRIKVGGKSLAGENGSKRELVRSEMEASYPCWLLYADLMKRIGFECERWNEGCTTYQDNMFKRWLRRNSETFDWKERRLQALCLALEAAAGSASCANLIKWMRERADKVHDKNGKEAVEKDSGVNAVDNSSEEAKENTTDKDTSPTAQSIYDKEREKLIPMNKVELNKFDRMTKEMNLVAGSIIHKNRVDSRAALVRKHRASVKNLAMRQYIEEHEATPANTEVTEKNEKPKVLSEAEPTPKPLPLLGSRATVYNIVELLLRQCIQLKAFKGGLLAVQSYLDYSKLRVSRHERSMELQKENELLRAKEQGLVQPGFEYDQINFESDDSDQAYISDDEDLAQPGVLQSLKSGRLPVNIRAVHAICLFGAGGKDYIALRCLDRIIQSNELDSFDEEEISTDVGVADENKIVSIWELHAPLNNTFVLSSLADLATANVRGHPRSLHSLLSILKKYFLTNVMINEGLDFDEVLASGKELEKAHALKMLLASLKLLIDCARMDLALLDGLDEEEVNTIEQVVNESALALKIMTRFQYILWNPCFSDWSLPQSSVDIVSILSGAISVLVQAASLVQDKRVIRVVQVGFRKSRQFISKICQADNTASESSAFSRAATWRSFPLPHGWQTSFHQKISLRAYNLCIAGCVSSFSGWEPSEFNLDQLRKSNINFFGVMLEGPCVAGFLPDNAASAVAEQWDYISHILPDLELLPFEEYLEDRKKMNWYQKVRKTMEKQSLDSSKISTYGEQNGIRALLSFSTLCLILAEESEGDEKDEFVKLSMSVLLPMTQFSIDKQVWQSSIGTLVMTFSGNETKIGFYLDENYHWSGPTKTKQGQIQHASNRSGSRPATAAKPTWEQRKPSNVVKVPTSALLEQWRKDDVRRKRKSAASEDAQGSMKRLDDAMKNLRKSRTLNSLERASIDVSLALLSLVEYDECNNPFLCMQQAAMFAAMGSKRGNNDEPFKRFLPLRDRCTPLEALNVLCRADCLRAVHFLHEAQYLCTWVASVCEAHREKRGKDLTWTSRWHVIGILTYIVSTTIDETSEALSLDDPNAWVLRKWEEAAITEINRGKSDALVLVKAPGANALHATERIESLRTEVPLLSDHINEMDRLGRHTSEDPGVGVPSNPIGYNSEGPSGPSARVPSNPTGYNRRGSGAGVPSNPIGYNSEGPGAGVPSNPTGYNSEGHGAGVPSNHIGYNTIGPCAGIPLNHFAYNTEDPGAGVSLNHIGYNGKGPVPFNYNGCKSVGPEPEVPLHSGINGMNHFGGYDEIDGMNVEQYLNEGLDEPEIEGVHIEGEDDDNPFAGVEIVGI